MRIIFKVEMLQAFSLYVYRPMCSWAILPQAAWALQASSVRLHVQMYFNVFALILCWFVVNQYKSSRIAASEVHLVCLHEWGPLIITTPWLQANFPQQLQLFTHGWLNFQWCRNYLLTLVPNGYHSGKVTKRKTLFHIYVCSQTHNSPVHQSSAS